MSEVRPQFTYSPDGELSIVAGLGEGWHNEDKSPEELAQYRSEQEQSLSELDAQPEIEVVEVGGIAVVSIDVTGRFAHSFNNQGDSDIISFLESLNRLLPFHPTDQIDRVFSLDNIYDIGATGVINHHFQRWLDAVGITEEASRSTIGAMALPFGEGFSRRITKDFSYLVGDDYQHANSTSWSVTARSTVFGIEVVEETPDSITYKDGQVRWSYLDISTLGSCACWGVDGMDRSRLTIDTAESMRLYEMGPHNVDYARQSLSLLLGIGSLTYLAARYLGREDVFADTEWGRSETHKKTTPDTV